VNPDDRALALAARIADGSGIDWPATEATPADADEHALLEELKAIAEVATLHRTPADWPREAAALAGTRWGPLTLLAKIGEGHFGCVYAAWDARLQRRVALKLLHAASPTALTSAIEEARLLARVRHPNVLAVYGAEAVDGQVGIWTEFIEGCTLERLLAECGPLPPEEVVAIGLDLCRALAAVHEAGLLHRDIKAQNVMRETGGRIVLMDFGTGHDLDAVPTRSGDLSGTPLYLAPELYAGARATPESDLYALAVLLFFLLTGRYPMPGRTLDDVRTGHQAGRMQQLRDVASDLPAALVEAIDSGLAANPAARYESAGAFEAALGRLQATSTLASRTQALRWPWQHPWVAAVALVVVLGVFSLAYVTVHRPAKAPIPFQAREWVLVTTFDNRTGDLQFDGTLEHALTYELSNSSYVNVVSRERVDDVLRLMARPSTTIVDAATGPEIALRDGGIRLVLDGRIERVGAGYAMTAQIVEPHVAATIASDREEAPTAIDVPKAVRRLSNWIRVRLGEAPAMVQQDDARLERATTPSLRALRAYSEGVRAFNLGQLHEAEALFDSALVEDPTFALAHTWRAWTLGRLGRPRDIQLASAQRAVDLVGTTSERERYWILGSYDRLTGQDEAAIGQFEALARRYPDDEWGLNNLVQLYGLAGRRQAAATLLVQIADAQPNNFAARVHAAQQVLQTKGLEAARPQAARAVQLLSAAPDAVEGGLGPAKTWTLVFPAHDWWSQGRGKESASALDAASARPELDAEGEWALNIQGKLRLALGQVRLAEGVYSRITDPGPRAIAFGELALARGDHQAVVAQLSVYPGYDPVAVSLLVRAGDLDAADRLLRRLPNFNPADDPWARAEIAEARGDTRLTTDALKADLPWTRAMSGGAKVFLYAETLARAAVSAGNTAGAIRVLEQTEALAGKAYTPFSQSGFYWMRTEKLLADVYRQTGQADKARVVERKLLSALAAADDDYPLLVELKARAGTASGTSTLAPSNRPPGPSRR
jgi:tetratricopeptide (TPR) repeat protein